MGTKAKHHVAPIVRGAFLEALERIKDEDRKTYSEIIADWIRGEMVDGKPSYSGMADVLNAVSKFNVRESAVEGEINVNTLESVLAGLPSIGHAGDDTEVEEEPARLRH